MRRPTTPTAFPRRSVLAAAAALPLGALAARLSAQGAAFVPPTAPAAAPAASPAVTLPASFPQQDPQRVSEMVGASHGNVERVRALLAETPALAEASWDWGYGDWETALGAASHVGNREIAELLLAHGARPTVFSAAMLGQLAVVRAFVEAMPAVVATPGPHGIPLVHHARAGGEQAAEVLRYLESLPAANAAPNAATTAEQRQPLLGRYAWGGGATEAFEVTEQREFLNLTRIGGSPRRLVPTGSGTFHPAGAPAVRVDFELAGGAAATALTVRDGAIVVQARRVAS
jgi:hypothetical protein